MGRRGEFSRERSLAIRVRRRVNGGWGTGATNHGQVGVKWILILGAHNLVQVIGSGGARRDLVILFKDGDIVISISHQMEGRREAEGTASDNGNGRGFGNHDGHFVEFVMLSLPTV